MWGNKSKTSALFTKWLLPVESRLTPNGPLNPCHFEMIASNFILNISVFDPVHWLSIIRLTQIIYALILLSFHTALYIPSLDFWKSLSIPLSWQALKYDLKTATTPPMHKRTVLYSVPSWCHLRAKWVLLNDKNKIQIYRFIQKSLTFTFPVEKENQNMPQEEFYFAIFLINRVLKVALL